MSDASARRASPSSSEDGEDVLAEVHARIDAAETAIAAREREIAERDARLAAREASRERSPRDKLRDRIRELETMLALARRERDEARAALPSPSDELGPGAVLGCFGIFVLLLLVASVLGGMPR